MYVADNAFESMKVSLSWIMHEEANLMNDIADVGASEGKVP